MVYDSVRDRVVLFGGTVDGIRVNDTWESDGGAFVLRRPSSAPPLRSSFAMAFDVARGRTVVFGGSRPNGVLGDTWEWDGVRWQQRSPSIAPAARFGAAMAYDERRGRVVLYGGARQGTTFADTWEWDGNSWLPMTAATIVGAPGPRFRHEMVYDVARGRVVLFGGVDSELWEWDGVQWSQIVASGAPSPRQGAAVYYDRDRRRVVVVGGWYSAALPSAPPTTAYGDSWEFDGVGWTATPGVSARHQAAAVYHTSRRAAVLVGGQRVVASAGPGLAATSAADVWRRDLGRSWQLEAEVAPAARNGAAAIYDSTRGALVVFGGVTFWGPSVSAGDTWRWDGLGWNEVRTAGPTGRFEAGMAFDSTRSVSVLFGGVAPAVGEPLLLDSQTWEFDGALWRQRSPFRSPSARAGLAMAHDGSRGVTVLFGGRGPNSTFLGDTWEWDGTDWTAVVSGQAPSAREAAAIAFDPSRGRTVLFGGQRNAGFSTLQFGDTWEWDGSAWRAVSPAGAGPSPRAGARMHYDPILRAVVLCGGEAAGTVLADCWAFDGTAWQALPTGPANAARAYHVQVWDARRGQTVMFGGLKAVGRHGDTWIVDDPAPGVADIGGGCVAGGPDLVGYGIPRLGNVEFGMDLLGGASSRPGVVLFSAAAASVPLGGGCVLAVDPARQLLVLPRSTNASGFFSLPIPVPDVAALSGARLFVQGAVLDATAPLGFGLTPASALSFGG